MSAQNSDRAFLNKWMRALLSASAVLTAACAPAAIADDDDCRDARIVPRDHRVDGRTYAEWTAAWYGWITAFGPDENPVIDADGSDAAVGQSGPVWFLAGTFGGPAVRTVTIPADKYLLLPIANAEWDTVPGLGNPLNLPDPLSVRDIRAITAFFMDGAELTCEIDGCAVRGLRRQRVKSPVFSFNMNPALQAAFGYPAPYVRTAVADGYWLILRPLSAGEHVIHFTANSPNTGFALDVTYNITVLP